MILLKRIALAAALFGVTWLIACPVGREALAVGGVARLKVVPEETRIDFVAGYNFLSRHLEIGGKVGGRLKIRSGEAQVDLQDPTKGASAEIVIDPRSLDTENRWRDEILRKEYLEVERYPEIRFRLTKVSDFRRSSEGGALSLHGRLTLQGVTREIVTKARWVREDRRVVVEGEAVVPMTSFGMKLPELSPFLRARDEVEVAFRLVLERAEE